MDFKATLISELKNRGANLISFVDISGLPVRQNKKFPVAILIGKMLSRKYLQQITAMPEYVDLMVRTSKVKDDEFADTEHKTDRLADFAAAFLSKKGYSAYSQSEDNIYTTGFYDVENQITPLPHKTIARLAGWGWIGKHNLLVTRKYGSAVSMCSVLTNAPVTTNNPVIHEPACNNCRVCTEVCTPGAIKGITWSEEKSRDDLIDVTKCTTCLKCLVFCPFTQVYMKSMNG